MDTNGRSKTNGRTNAIWRVSSDVLLSAIETSINYSQVLRSIGLEATPSNRTSLYHRIDDEGFDISHFQRRAGTDTIIVRKNRVTIEDLRPGSFTDRGVIKRFLIRTGIIPIECSLCRITTEWQGKPIVLVLDHINGINNDHRIENLRLLCPNCNSQTDTFSGRNAKVKAHKNKIHKKKKTNSPKRQQLRRFDPSVSELTDMVWSMPIVKVAEHYGVSNVAVTKRCKLFNIERPQQGYWIREDNKGVKDMASHDTPNIVH